MFQDTLKQHIECISQLNALAPAIDAAGELLANAITERHSAMVCGNGGSAADAQHFAAELIGRFEKERNAWPAIALTTDTSILTAIGNDYGFSEVFARQVQGLGKAGDVLIGISTSGNSENIIKAVSMAQNLGIHTIGLLGSDGGHLKESVDHAIIVKSRRTARIQEAHIVILHYWASIIEARLTGSR